MKNVKLITEAIGTLTINKLRTGLAMLGIVIGIGSVIALVSLGQASQEAIQSQIQSLGANLLTVNPGSQRTGAVRGAAGSETTLTNADAEAIKTDSAITTVSAVSSEINQRAQVVAGKNNTNVRVNGVTSIYASVHKVTMDSGVFITDQDDAGIAKVVVLGPQVVSDLFGEGSNPIGQNIRIKGTSFRVVGVATSKGGSGFLNQDDVIYIPLSTAQKQVFGQTYLSNISLEAKSADVMTEAQNQVGYLLLARHKLSDPTQADFSILSQQDILNTANSTTSTFTTLLSGIAAISLVVGGIGIMNIMLVTVTERTREIGLRKALGAKKNVIVRQFLIESIILTFTGGSMGIVLGILVSYLYSLVNKSTFFISTPSILIAFVVSALVGVLFGWYPAQRAANLQPIEALRYE
ncbi:MAG: ABC transporter permease [Candidatus Woesebacteria bacterium]|nr:MAG: ABC transporter permease [Candidatus Woesebacteria bacterium]